MADNNNGSGNSNNTSQENTNEAQDPSRRRFVKNTGMVIGGVAGGSLLGGLFTNQFMTEDQDASGKENKKSNKGPDEARMFFTSFDDFAALEQATERIYPEDDNGPGAIELGVPIFIDKQLAGDWGSNKKDYMKGPAQEVDDIDSYQTLMNRGEVFIEGLRKINSESQKRHDDKFFNVEEEQQEAILQDMQDEKLELDGVRARTFFNLLRQMTLEGAYSDPLYGGNRGMQGWKMKEYPGVRAGYSDLVDSEEFQKLEPSSLKDYQQQ